MGKIDAADGSASYADSVTLNVPVDTGYRIFVYYRATSGDPWGIYGSSPGDGERDGALRGRQRTRVAMADGRRALKPAARPVESTQWGASRRHCRTGQGQRERRRSRKGGPCDTTAQPLVLIVAVLAALFAPAMAAAAGAGTMAPLNPAYLESLVGSPVGVPSSAVVGQALGESPGPQDLSYTSAMDVPGVPAFTLPTSYDLRTLGRVTSVKDQNPYGTCWSFAACGSLESCLLPGESRDFSEDNMVLASGFNYPGSPYDAGGQIFMSTAYLVRWGGPVYEGDDAYGDAYTPAGLTPREHVQEVDWLPVRSSALDNDDLKTAVRDHGAVDVSMGWYGSSSGSSYYNATTKSYYYNGDSSTNHEVLVVGWDDDYAAANFATTPAGNGAFIVKNSWGTGWGSNGYFYVSYYDSRFGRDTNPSAVFDQAEPTDNYAGVYQYDPLGDCAQYGFSNSTGWFANVFTAQTTSSLSAVGFYTLAPGTSYEVYTGSSLATRTLSTSGTEASMGYHTVTLPSPITVTKGQPFTVAVKVTSPGTSYPIAIECPFDDYSSGATASTGQSYVSLNGSNWTDIAGLFTNTNVCLKAYVKAAGPGSITVTAPDGHHEPGPGRQPAGHLDDQPDRRPAASSASGW